MGKKTAKVSSENGTKGGAKSFFVRMFKLAWKYKIVTTAIIVILFGAGILLVTAKIADVIAWTLRLIAGWCDWWGFGGIL